MLVTELAAFFEGLVQNVFEFCRNARIEAHRGHWAALENFVEDDARSFARKRQRAGGHFIEHRAEAEKIAARVEFLPAHLLGRHVSDGADCRARAGEIFSVETGGLILRGRGRSCC